jgi:hypothetical protein
MARVGPDSFSPDANYALHVSTTVAGGGVRITGTDAGAAGVNVVLQHDSVSPLDGDIVGQVLFNGDDSAGNETEYGKIATEIQDPTNTPSEESIMRFSVQENGNTTEYLRLDGTDALTRVTASKNVHAPMFGQDQIKGATNTLKHATEELTFAANPGDASKTTTGLIPDGVFLKSISTRVVTAGTNCTSFDIGDGSVQDLWGNDISVADATTTSNANATASWAALAVDAAEVTLTANGGNCFDMVVRVVATYEQATAPTID